MKEKLETLLNQHASLSDIQQFCRLISKEEVNKRVKDEEVRAIGGALCELVYFPIRTKIEVEYGSVSSKKDKNWIVPTCGTFATLGIGWLVGRTTDSYFWGAVAGGIITGISLMLMCHNNGSRELYSEPSQKILSSVDEIYEMTMRFVEMIEKTALFRVKTEKPIKKDYPLEERYYTVLEFLNNSYVECLSYGEECSRYFQKQIERTLKLSGYEIVDYSEESEDSYQVYPSQETKSTINVAQYAIRNIETKHTIVKGVVYIKK